MTQIEYHRARASRHEAMADTSPAYIALVHRKLAGLHSERARLLETGQLTGEDDLLLVTA